MNKNRRRLLGRWLAEEITPEELGSVGGRQMNEPDDTPTYDPKTGEEND